MGDKLLETMTGVQRLAAAGKIAGDPRVVKLLGLAQKRIEELDKGAWSSISDRLAVKALETLQRAVHRWEQGEITGDSLGLIADAVYDTVVGLVPWDCAETIDAVKKEMRQ